jgi:DNA-binding NarL/FixJ family response regulator
VIRLVKMTTVLIVEADPELRALLQLLLEFAPNVSVAGALGSVPDAVAACQRARPDVLVVDDGVLQQAALTPYGLRQQLPGTGVLVLALYPANTPEELAGDSTVGFLAKDSPLAEVAAVIHRLAVALPTAQRDQPTGSYPAAPGCR